MGHLYRVVSKSALRAILLADVSYIVPGCSGLRPPFDTDYFTVSSAYEYPEAFIPERWYSRPELVKDRRAFAPFGIGKLSSPPP